jgi:hypothetical protein
MISLEELLNAPISDLSLKQLNDAFYEGTKAIYHFAKEVMIGQLTGLLQANQQESAVRETYYRMYLLLGSVVALNSLQHLQSVASATRALFELWLDIKQLAADATGSIVEKFHAFPEIERYRVAEQLIKFAQKNPRVLKGTDISRQQAFYDDPERKKTIASLKIDRNGKPVFPKHWSGKNNLRQRAKDLGLEAWYVEAYPLLSWYVHSGSAGTAGMCKDGFESCFGFCHILVQRIFLDATLTCAKVTRISDAINSFDKWMQRLKLKTGELIISEQITMLEEARSK